MKQSRLPLLGVVLILLAFLSFAIRKTVTIVIDGQSQKISTFALTTSQLLYSASIVIGNADAVEPGPQHWLKNGDTIQINHAAQVLIWADQTLHRLETVNRTPSDWLSQAGIPLSPGDEILLDGEQVSPVDSIAYKPVHSLEVKHSNTFVYSTDQKKETVTSSASSLGRALWESGITARESDLLSHSLLEPIPEGQQGTSPVSVYFYPGKQLSIHADGKNIVVQTNAYSVGEALAEQHIALQGVDYSVPPLEAALPQNGDIRVVRVLERLLVEQEPVAFETQYQPAPEVEIDNQAIIQAGEYGLKDRRVRVRMEDGVEVSRQVEDEWVAKAPKNRILGYGTKVVMHTLNTPDGQIQYWRVLTMWITSYHPSEGGGHRTATGKVVVKGIIAVNPNYIPYGTQMYVPGYGVGSAQDTGQLSARWIDLGYPDAEYISWAKYSQVYFLWPPPANINYNFPP